MNLEVVFPFSREKRMLVHGAPALHRLPGKGRNSQSLRVCHQGVGGRRVVEGRIQPPYLQLVALYIKELEKKFSLSLSPKIKAPMIQQF